MQNQKFTFGKVYSKGEMAGFYHVSSKTWTKWVKPIAKKHYDAFPEGPSSHAHFYTPRQIKIIVEELGPI